MQNKTYITFENDANFRKDYLNRDIEGVFIDIKIGDKEFEVFLDDRESEVNYEEYKYLGDDQYELVNVVSALKKLTRFLELSVDIGFSKNLIE
ncbi:hypothetical protein [Romboutsia timonensis]|uniref:hypothetical protein n=1 Tax=Romboutsia timonensis TaxID=1776391 RepID=UPI002A75EB59|nr:hypothetical protein [Romboutsia timonensis]MDY3001913.1 hypothetical protein [Romboutsia timonensis]MDY3960718.1 hypothetical protein [Romboutsia timonensis]